MGFGSVCVVVYRPRPGNLGGGGNIGGILGGNNNSGPGLGGGSIGGPIGGKEKCWAVGFGKMEFRSQSCRRE